MSDKTVSAQQLTVLLFLHYCQHVPLLTKLCLSNICRLSQLQPRLAKQLTITQHKHIAPDIALANTAGSLSL